MASSKYELMWEILQKFEFEKCEEVTSDMMCTICKKLMCQPHITLCGCYFCGDCVKEYLSDEVQYCPGGGEECSSEYMVLNKNVLPDLSMSRYIAKLVLKCPYSTCNVKCVLENMKEHIDFCDKKPIICPYSKIGCDEGRTTDEGMTEHLYSDGIHHAKILLKTLDNFSNKVDSLDEVVKEKDSEIQYLMKESEKKDELISELRNEISSVYERVDADASMFRNMLNAMEEKYDTHLQATATELSTFRTLFEETVGGHSSSLVEQMDNLKEEGNKYQQEIYLRLSSILKLNRLIPHIATDFIWKFDEFSTKSQASPRVFSNYFFSDPFYSCDYKFCLYVLFLKDEIEFRCFLMKSEKDNKLPWPMRVPVTLGIIDQYSLRLDKNFTYRIESYSGDRSAFDQPIKDRNPHGIGTSSFVGVSYILGQPGLVLYDSVYFSCELNKFDG